MPCAVELAWLAIGGQLLRCAFDPATLFSDQVQRFAGQARCQGLQKVIGQFTRLGQEQHGGAVVTFCHLRAEVAAVGKARREQRLISGMPVPASRLWQRAEQIVGWQASQQQLAFE